MSQAGNQQIVWKYQTPLNSSLLRTNLVGGIKPGLTEQLTATFTGFTLTIAAGLSCYVPVRGQKQMVKMTTTSDVDIACSVNTIAIGVYFTQQELSDHYCEIVALTPSAAETFEGIIACCLSCDSTGVLAVYPERADFTTEYYRNNGLLDYIVEHKLPYETGYDNNVYKLTKLGKNVTDFTFDLSGFNEFLDAEVEVEDLNYNNLGPASEGHVVLLKEAGNYYVRLVSAVAWTDLYHVFAKLTKSGDTITIHNFQDISIKTPPYGFATLDQDGRIPYSQLPESAIEFKGTWSAADNDPHLENGTGTKGDMYVCIAAGMVDFGDGDVVFKENDRVIYDGSVWINLKAGNVRSVNGVEPDATGNVFLKHKEFTYVVNSDASLAYWLSNKQSGISSGGNDFTSVLIRKGEWNFTGETVALDTIGTLYVEGEAGSKLVVTNATTALGYTSTNNTVGRAMYNVNVRCYNSAADALAFYYCSNLTNCIGTATGTQAQGFGNCSNLTNCIGTCNATGSFIGMFSAAFWGCSNLTNCIGTGIGTYDFGFYFSNVVHGCRAGGHCGAGVFNQCFADFSFTATYTCADTPNGGFNNTTNPSA